MREQGRGHGSCLEDYATRHQISSYSMGGKQPRTLLNAVAYDGVLGDVFAADVSRDQK